MTEVIQVTVEAPTDATGGIPVKNLWHMLLYAWDSARFLSRWNVEVDAAPCLDALLASVLTKLVEQRLRIGLGRGYTNDARTLRTIRGRVDFAESLKRLAFENGQAHCRFQTYSHNVPKNQIVRSTMARLVQTGRFGPDRPKAENLRGKLRQLVRALDGIDPCEPTPDLIRRQNLGRNDADYRLMLNICDLLLRQRMPTENEGRHSLPGLDRQQIILHKVFERFVANFYRLCLRGWTVKSQKQLEWHADKTSDYLPIMSADAVLHETATGRTVVLDTKFTSRSLIANRWGNRVFDSSHVYQIYAYLRSQEHLSNSDRHASGILLYPTVGEELDETVVVQGHPIHFRTIDLSLPWQDIESRLLSIVTSSVQPHPTVAFCWSA
ncbi:MAG: 5-methylcytosine restriction system specificity protein McrC [Verrucomicrobiia bacterium]